MATKLQDIALRQHTIIQAIPINIFVLKFFVELHCGSVLILGLAPL